MHDLAQPDVVIPAFDAYAAERGLVFDAVILGGAALVLLGVVVPLARRQFERLGKELGHHAVR